MGFFDLDYFYFKVVELNKTNLGYAHRIVAVRAFLHLSTYPHLTCFFVGVSCVLRCGKAKGRYRYAT